MGSRIEFISRIIGALVAASALAIIGVQLAGMFNLEPIPYAVALGVGGGLLGALFGFLFTPYLTIRPINAVRQALSAMPLERLVALMIGVFLGLIAAALFSIPLSQLPSPLKEILPLASALGFCYLGAVLMMNRYRDLREWVGGLRPSRNPAKVIDGSTTEDEDVILLDTSVIIDGRILDIGRTGFIRHTLLVPNFVLKELQHIAEARSIIYVCGPTVYDYSHIGHAKTYVGFDVVVRYLRFSGYDVLYVQNITDVGHLLDTGEDRILPKARQLSALPMQVVETYTRATSRHGRPGRAPARHQPARQRPHPGANRHDRDAARQGARLRSRRLGLLRRRLLPGVRQAERPHRRGAGRGRARRRAQEKRHPADFALWKRAEPEHILRWPSPWGEGFPGWHIECSAMSAKYLGETFDIHGGGIDNIFPHNECEIAQSEAAHDAPFARYWMLTGSLTLDGSR
jgi:hypothetical protein